MRAVYKLSILSALTVMGAAACADILGFERFTGVAEDAGTVIEASSVDATADTAPQPPPPECLSLGLPAAPTDAGDKGDAGANIVVALSRFDIGIKDDAGVSKPVGLNLDLTCTTSQDTSSCELPTVTDGDFKLYQADKPNGVDNAGFALISYLATAYDGVTAETFNAELERGRFGLVLVISGYNGLPDDPNVRVNAFPALGVEPRAGQDAGVPQFNSTDRWIFDREYATIPNDDGYTILGSRDAYVSGGKLVAYFPKFAVGLPFPNNDRLLTIALNEAYVVGTLTKVGTEYEVTEGVITGRWPAADALLNINELRINNVGSPGSTPVCKSTLVSGLVKAAICGGLDLSSSSAEKDAAAPCDSISVAVGFQAKPGDFGTGRKGTPLPTDCPDAGGCTPSK